MAELYTTGPDSEKSIPTSEEETRIQNQNWRKLEGLVDKYG